MASALIANDGRNYWNEVRHIKGKCKLTASVVNGKSDGRDIANEFMIVYKNLYNSVSSSQDDLTAIDAKVKCIIDIKSKSVCLQECNVSLEEVRKAVSFLKKGKSDGLNFMSDNIINGGDQLYVHLARLFSLLLHLLLLKLQ